DRRGLLAREFPEALPLDVPGEGYGVLQRPLLSAPLCRHGGGHPVRQDQEVSRLVGTALLAEAAHLDGFQPLAVLRARRRRVRLLILTLQHPLPLAGVDRDPAEVAEEEEGPNGQFLPLP